MTEEDLSFAAVIREKVEHWLEEEGWSVSPLSGQTLSWALQTDRGPSHMVVGQFSSKPDKVLIQSRFNLSPEQQVAFAAWDAERRKELLYEVRIELLRMGLNFDHISEPFEYATVDEEIFFEGGFDSGLAKDTFFQRLWRVRRGVAMLEYVFQLRLRV